MALAFAVAMALAGWRSCETAAADELSVGGGPNVSMLVIIGQKKGFFDAAGAKVAYHPLQTSKIAFDAVAAGQIDLGIVTDANIALLGYAGLGNVRIVGSIMTKTDDAIIARRDAGIAAPADLKGKRIAYTPASSGEAFLDLFLNSREIGKGQSELVPMTAPAMLAALQHGDVDAASVWQPFRYNIATSLGQAGVQFQNDDVYPAKILVIAAANTTSARKDDLTRFFSALAKTADFVRANTSQSIALVAPDTGIDATTLTATWGEYHFHTGETGELASDLRKIATALLLSEPALADKPMPRYETFFALDSQNEAIAASTRP